MLVDLLYVVLLLPLGILSAVVAVSILVLFIEIIVPQKGET